MRRHGFTLIELLIAVAILSMVVGLSTYAFSMFSSHWASRERAQLRSQGEYRRVFLLQRALSSCVPWVVRNTAGGVGFYFLGRDEGMTLVTARPIFSADVPAVIRVFREPDGPGRFKLVYEEAPLGSAGLSVADQQLIFRHRLVVLRNINSLTFRFFGWPSSIARAQATAADTGETQRWYVQFDGLRGVSHPDRLEIGINGASWLVNVPATADMALSRLGELE